jgi:type IV secretory pathway TrbF-like protein
MNWRLAALGSMSLAALLGLAIAISTGRANVVRYVTEVQSLPEVATAKVAPEPEGTPRRQIVFSADQSTTNIPSLSIDLATMRERWLDAYNYYYLEDREAETFNDYNRADGSLARPFSSVRHRGGHPWHRHRSHQTR